MSRLNYVHMVDLISKKNLCSHTGSRVLIGPDTSTIQSRVRMLRSNATQTRAFWPVIFSRPFRGNINLSNKPSSRFPREPPFLKSKDYKRFLARRKTEHKPSKRKARFRVSSLRSTWRGCPPCSAVTCGTLCSLTKSEQTSGTATFSITLQLHPAVVDDTDSEHLRVL